MKKIAWLAELLIFLLMAVEVRADAVVLDRPLELEVLESGELLVTDGGGSDWTNEGSEVLIVNREGEVVWQYGEGLVFAHSAHLFSDGLIVITDTTNDRIIAVDKGTKEIEWSSENWGGGTGELSDGTRLDYPNEAIEISEGVMLVTDRNNDRILEVDKKGRVLWKYEELERPHNASKLEDGNYLVSDSEGHRAVMISKSGKVLWEFDGGDDGLKWPRDVKLIENGNFLITDTRKQRVLEVTKDGKKVWEFDEGLYWPYEAERLENGNTLISDSQNGRVIEVTPAGEVVWELELRGKKEFGSFRNGGFEKVDNGQLSGWVKADLLAEGAGEFVIDEEVSYVGKKSVRIDYDGKGHIFWLQKVEVSEGEEYEFSGWVKTSLDESEKSWARYELWWETEKGGFVDPPLISEKSLGKSGWVKREWKGKAPQGAVAVNIRAIMTGKGSSWFDEVEWSGGSSKSWLYLLYFAVGFGVVGIGQMLVKRFMGKK